MIPFTDLAETVKAIRDKTGLYTTVQANCTAFRSDLSITYKYYDEKNSWSKEFPTVQELQAHMDNILNPKTDIGVSL